MRIYIETSWGLIQEIHPGSKLFNMIRNDGIDILENVVKDKYWCQHSEWSIVGRNGAMNEGRIINIWWEEE